jgi:hypothetical protein
MHKKTFQWAVIGAGPAGIAAVGKLMDAGIEPEHILWLDPHFTVGDLGRYWKNVSSNTVANIFLDFLNASNAFSYKEAPLNFTINHLPEQETCTLIHIVEPLQWITNEFRRKVDAQPAIIHELALQQRIWTLSSDAQDFFAHNIILAPGAVPESLSYSSPEEIPFYTAIDKEKLSACFNPQDTYAVFGSSHSAILILKYLVELGAKQIINFYQSPCRYAIPMENWILFDNTGLKGKAAQWARENIDGIIPSNLKRYPSTETNIQQYLPHCDKTIYAVGFKKRSNINIRNYPEVQYDSHLGIIAPGLFGLGIAYPELITNPFGSTEYQVGLWKFMAYLQKILPLWLKYPT